MVERVNQMVQIIPAHAQTDTRATTAMIEVTSKAKTIIIWTYWADYQSQSFMLALIDL